jgi:hypothetical protein
VETREKRQSFYLLRPSSSDHHCSPSRQTNDPTNWAVQLLKELLALHSNFLPVLSLGTLSDLLGRFAHVILVPE